MQRQAEASRLIERIIARVRATRGADALVSVESKREGNTRFAANEITSSSSVDKLTISLRVQFGQRSAQATANQQDDRSLDELVGRAIRMARLAPENPEQMPPLGRQNYPARRPALDPAAIDPAAPDLRAKAVGAALAAGDARVVIAGFVSHGVSSRALGTSAGLSAYHAWSAARFSCTARTPDGTGSGWASLGGTRMADLDTAQLLRVAVDKATSSANPRRLEPGRYTVVLEPAAVIVLLDFLIGSLAARDADEGRSFFTKRRPGHKLFPEAITLRSDPSDAALGAVPFDAEGVPLAATRWIDKGRLTALAYSRYWARKQGVAATGTPSGFTLEGGAASRDELIRGVKRGVLVTRLWYPGLLDPQSILATGLTRDGVYLIENGAIVHPVNNFRFNESPIQMLANCDGLGATSIPALGEVWETVRVPILRTNEFNLASISEAI